MTQEQYSTGRRKFQHLTSEKRAQIEILLRLKLPKSRIAAEVGISRSTLYNELARGTVVQLDSELRQYTKYFADAGQRVYEKHRENSRPPLKLVKAAEFVAYAEQQILKEKHGPETVCGEARRSGKFAEMVCAKTLYNYIDQCLLTARNIDLELKVKRKQKQSVHHGRENKRLFGMSIEERPEAVNNREEFGHWEADTVVGKRESEPVLLRLDERTKDFNHTIKIPNRSAESVEWGIRQIQKLYGDKFDAVFKSITCDNGSEFATLPRILPNTAIYYAHPYSAYERGLNEKQNSLVRRFLPKGCSLVDVTPETVQRIQDWINRFPRKAFGYATPEELFRSVLFDIAI